MKSYLLLVYIVCFYFFEFFPSLRFYNNKKIQKINRYLTFHDYDNRQVKMILNNDKETFFKNKKVSNSQFYFNYQFLTYSNIHETFENLSLKYPKLISTYTAQDKYGIPHPVGDCDSKKFNSFHL